jgi:hypothetical protein
MRSAKHHPAIGHHGALEPHYVAADPHQLAAAFEIDMGYGHAPIREQLRVKGVHIDDHKPDIHVTSKHLHNLKGEHHDAPHVVTATPVHHVDAIHPESKHPVKAVPVSPHVLYEEHTSHKEEDVTHEPVVHEYYHELPEQTHIEEHYYYPQHEVPTIHERYYYPESESYHHLQ